MMIGGFSLLWVYVIKIRTDWLKGAIRIKMCNRHEFPYSEEMENVELVKIEGTH